MSSEKNFSSLSEHKLYRRQGRVVAPFNDNLGDQLSLNSWTKERMPEYLWLGLILMDYGRREGLQKAQVILSKISNETEALSTPKLSEIFNLKIEEQKAIFQLILEDIEACILSPLTVFYRTSNYPVFNDFFNIPEISFEKRVIRVSDAIKIYSNHQSNEATDLRFLILCFLNFSKKIVIAPNLSHIVQCLEEYPYISHDDERMRRYRPTVRSMEGGFTGKDDDIEFSNIFWQDIGMITKCNPMTIIHKNSDVGYQLFIENFQKILQYILHSYKSESLSNDKFDVIVGSITYALKIFNEVHKNSLGNSILGRHGIRTIIEILIILKYLIKHELDNPKIWEEYKIYGIGKYKLILLKARENKTNKSAHFSKSVADMLVNEIKWEEFIDVDLKYFDKQGIREKSIEVGEKFLYDLFYDYDSSFAHGLWGSVRESSMLICDNMNHPDHIIPDIFMAQNLPDVKADSFDVMDKLLSLLTQAYPVPDTLLETE